MARVNLRLRGRQYYLHLAIPRSLRQHFLSPGGKQRDAVWEPLGPDLTSAKPEAAQRAAEYERLFARLRVAAMAPDAIRAELEAIKQRAEDRRSVADLPLLQSELERIRLEYATNPAEAIRARVPKPTQQERERALAEATRRYRHRFASTVAAIVKDVNPPIEPGT